MLWTFSMKCAYVCMFVLSMVGSLRSLWCDDGMGCGTSTLIAATPTFLFNCQFVHLVWAVKFLPMSGFTLALMISLFAPVKLWIHQWMLQPSLLFQVFMFSSCEASCTFWEVHEKPCLCYICLRLRPKKKGYFWRGASTFWTMSLAPSTTSVISTAVSSTFSAVIRSSGIDSAKPHLPPAFLASVKRKSVWISCDDSRRECVGRIKCGTVC